MTDAHDEVREKFASAEEIPPIDGDMPPPRTPDDGGAQPPEDPERSPVERCAVLPLNDYGNGQRFSIHFGEDVMFVPRVGWFKWNGKAWRKDADEIEVRKLSQKVAATIEEELPHLYLCLDEWDQVELREGREIAGELRLLRAVDDDDLTAEQKDDIERLEKREAGFARVKKRISALRQARHRHIKNAGNSGPMKNLLGESSVGLSRDFDELDANPLEVNTESGILRFTVDREAQRAMRRDGCSDMDGTASVECIPHDRARLLSKMMPVEYDPDAKAPLFDSVLNRIQPDPEMREFLQRWFGLNMTALTGDQVMMFLYGVGANGKSLLMDLIAHMMGDYACTAKIESLTGSNRRGGGDATPDLIPLMGARMTRASEPEQGEKLKEGLIKELTGGEPMLVRALHSDFIEVRPLFKLSISGNYKPEIRGTDDGIWRRVLLTPFDVQIPKDERDPDLGKKLWAERSGILNWMIEGLIMYLENGLQVPQKVVDATQEFREDSDPVHTFLAECCEVTGDVVDSIRASELKDAFQFWLRERGETAWTDTTCSRRISAKADKWRDERTGMKFTKAKASVALYRGIRLADLFKQRFDARPMRSTSPASNWEPAP